MNDGISLSLNPPTASLERERAPQRLSDQGRERMEVPNAKVPACRERGGGLRDDLSVVWLVQRQRMYLAARPEVPQLGVEGPPGAPPQLH